MLKTTQLLVLATLAVAPFAVGIEVSAQAVDDGPCPAGTVGTLPQAMYDAGVDYRDGVWYDADGRSFGTSAQEDECIHVATDDLAPSAWSGELRELAGVAPEDLTVPAPAPAPRVVEASDPAGSGLPVTL